MDKEASSIRRLKKEIESQNQTKEECEEIARDSLGEFIKDKLEEATDGPGPEVQILRGEDFLTDQFISIKEQIKYMVEPLMKFHGESAIGFGDGGYVKDTLVSVMFDQILAELISSKEEEVRKRTEKLDKIRFKHKPTELEKKLSNLADKAEIFLDRINNRKGR